MGSYNTNNKKCLGFLHFISHLVLNMNASFTMQYCILLLLFQNWRRQKLIWRLLSPKPPARIMSMIACWRSMRSYRWVGPDIYWIEQRLLSCYFYFYKGLFTQVIFNCRSDIDTTYYDQILSIMIRDEQILVGGGFRLLFEFACWGSVAYFCSFYDVIYKDIWICRWSGPSWPPYAHDYYYNVK